MNKLLAILTETPFFKYALVIQTLYYLLLSQTVLGKYFKIAKSNILLLSAKTSLNINVWYMHLRSAVAAQKAML